MLKPSFSPESSLQYIGSTREVYHTARRLSSGSSAGAAASRPELGGSCRLGAFQLQWGRQRTAA